jgi:tetratricopeptide (TPR) repeat protein
MTLRHVLLVLALISGSWTGVPRALAQAPAPATLTAEEQLQKANAAYTAGQWAEAAAGYAKFTADFGQRLEAQQAVSRVRYPLARCYLQLRKFAEALTAIDAALASQPPIGAQDAQELSFWRGVCLMQDEKYAETRAALERYLTFFPKDAWRQPAYVAQYPASRHAPEAQLLVATSFVLEEKWAEAADYCAALAPSLDALSRGRATVLELYARVEAGDLDRALGVVKAEYPRLDDMIQVVTFQTLTLGLGAQLLERGDFRSALVCLARVWPAERLRARQQGRLADLETQAAALEANPRSDAALKLTVGQLIAKVKRELEQFEKIPNFDSALRLRMATAYQAMQRYREAALILEGMLQELPPDAIVEQASVALVQCWGQIERWPRVITAAQEFAKKFPQSKQRPLVQYLQGVAEQKNLQYEDAVKTLAALAREFPQSEFAPRAVFMEGFTRLLADQPAEALPVFERFRREYPQHDLTDAAAYWQGMALSLNKQFAECRTAMDEYLAKFPQGQYRGLAQFRKAYAAQSLADYATSIAELRTYLQQNPGHESNGEALVLLGDALMATGEMDEGMAAFARIAPEETRFFEEGWFKTGKALKLLERPDDLRAHMERFARERPRSGRLGEAIYWVGWCERQAGRPEEARKLYWETIAQHGDNPAMRSIDDLFPALSKLYKGDEERAQYLARLRDLREAADRKEQKTLALRALWAQALELQRREPEKARALLLEAAPRADVQTTNPLLLADFATARAAAGQPKEAEQMWRDLLKWNPRAPQKDRALAALGDAELARGNEKAALEYYDRFQKETAGSLLLGQVLLTRARLLGERGEFAPAQQALEALLAEKATPGALKSEALFRLGELQMRQKKPHLAVPYYQRIYVMYGRWTEWVAKAYLRSGEAFEQLQDNDAARKTYAEMLANDTLNERPEHAQAEDRLKKLGGPVERKEAL